MNLSQRLAAREAAGRPVTVGLIGAGKFGAMFLAQARRTAGLHVLAVADLDRVRAQRRLAETGWPAEQYTAPDAAAALRQRTTWITDDSDALIRADGLDVVIEATGIPAAGVRHAMTAIEHGRHVVMVTVEADVVAGPLLARKAQQAGVVYSLAWGDQPALVCEHVDWARTCGLQVVCAGKGTRYHPDYHALTPDTVWDVLAEYLAIRDRASINPRMFNSFLDGSKSAIEMAAVCNATGLLPQPDGLGFPPASRFELAGVCKPRADGGTLTSSGTVEVVSSLTRAHQPVPHHLALGTYVVFEGGIDYVRECFREYHMLPDDSGHYAALYRPIHMIGLELGVSVASVALRGEPTGCPDGFRADVVATAKRPLRAGETLDGEGGFTVWGKLLPAACSLAMGGLPLGLAHGVRLVRDIAAGDQLTWADVAMDERNALVQLRRELERELGG